MPVAPAQCAMPRLIMPWIEIMATKAKWIRVLKRLTLGLAISQRAREKPTYNRPEVGIPLDGIGTVPCAGQPVIADILHPSLAERQHKAIRRFYGNLLVVDAVDQEQAGRFGFDPVHGRRDRILAGTLSLGRTP